MKKIDLKATKSSTSKDGEEEEKHFEASEVKA